VATHSKSAWDTVLADTWLSEGVHEVEIGTDCVDNLSCYIGVVRRKHWAECEEDVAMRDSEDAICMHGDGRLFIKTKEKEWGMMVCCCSLPRSHPICTVFTPCPDSIRIQVHSHHPYSHPRSLPHSLPSRTPIHTPSGSTRASR